MISFPSTSVAPSVYTDFINGIKFDICEVDESCYNMLTNKRYRFFLCVNDTHIVDFKSAETFCNSTKEDRWDLFCKTMSDCKELINKFQNSHDRILKLEERSLKSKSLRISCTQKIHAIKKACIDTFGIYPGY